VHGLLQLGMRCVQILVVVVGEVRAGVVVCAAFVDGDEVEVVAVAGVQVDAVEGGPVVGVVFVQPGGHGLGKRSWFRQP
jgi:hypothetical protein